MRIKLGWSSWDWFVRPQQKEGSMAEDLQPVLQPTFDYVRSRLSRRKVLAALAVLVLVTVACFMAIGLMLDRLEVRNASFHPPMTTSERESLMPSDPRLDVSPSVDGLRYGREEQSASAVPVNHARDLSHAH
jgi:hypothetical protein